MFLSIVTQLVRFVVLQKQCKQNLISNDENAKLRQPSY